MPPRVAVAGIVLFWLATTAYTAYRDVWPRVFQTGPPPVTIELADEARQNVPAKWQLSRNGQKVGRLTTLMQYNDAENAFVFSYRYTGLKFEQSGVTLEVPQATSEVRMTRDGDLKAQTMNVQVSLGGSKEVGGTIDVRGAVTNGVLTGRVEIKSAFLNLAGDLDPVPVPKGLPLNPLQPVNRIANVTAGQQWQVSESNPMGEAAGSLIRKKLSEFGLRLPEEKKKDSLVAKVGDEPQPLKLPRGEEVACWVIEYRRAEPVARTWVRASDGKVMRQEAFEKGESLVFERED
jgi:hypothetical protein